MSSRPELLSIIVPVYNEVATSRAVIDRLLAVDLPLLREILIVNDGSTDGTEKALDADVGEGFADQGADLELDPGQLASLVDPFLTGAAEVVYGSRFLHGRSGAPFMTFAANRVLTAATNLLFGSSLTDMEACYKVMRVDVARSLDLTANRFDIEPEITARLLRRGYRIHEIPVRFEPRSRRQGKKIGWRDGIRALVVLGRERLRR